MVLRSAGSKGAFDLIAIRSDRVILIQVKRCQTKAQADRLIRKFKANPPLQIGPYMQLMEVQVKGSRELLSASV